MGWRKVGSGPDMACLPRPAAEAAGYIGAKPPFGGWVRLDGSRKRAVLGGYPACSVAGRETTLGIVGVDAVWSPWRLTTNFGVGEPGWGALTAYH